VRKEDLPSLGRAMFDFTKLLSPVMRSITGEGVKESLKLIKNLIPLEMMEVESGTKVFDWKVPREWNIKDTYIKNSKGKKVVNLKDSNLHFLNYSIPFYGTMSLEQLRPHLESGLLAIKSQNRVGR